MIAQHIPLTILLLSSVASHNIIAMNKTETKKRFGLICEEKSELENIQLVIHTDDIHHEELTTLNSYIKIIREMAQHNDLPPMHELTLGITKHNNLDSTSCTPTYRRRKITNKKPHTWILPNGKKKEIYAYPSLDNEKNRRYELDPELYETKFRAALRANLYLRKDQSEYSLQQYEAALLKTLHKNKQIIIQRQDTCLRVINYLNFLTEMKNKYSPQIKTIECYEPQLLLEWKK